MPENQIDFIFNQELNESQNLNGLIKLDNGKGKVEEYHQVFVDEYNQGLEPHLFVDQSGVVHRGRPLEIKGKVNYLSRSL